MSDCIPRMHKDLEHFLLRTLPASKRLRNLKVTVRKVTSNWEAPKRTLFPYTIFEPHFVSCLDDMPTKNPTNATFMFTKYAFTDGRTQIGSGDPSEGKPLGLVWTAKLPTADRLGKRTPRGELRDHSLKLSRFGVPFDVSGSPELTALLEKQSVLIAKLAEQLNLQESLHFRIRLDDVSQIFELCFYADDFATPLAKEVYHFSVTSPYDLNYSSGSNQNKIRLEDYGQILHDYHDPQTSVYQYILGLFEGQTTGVGILSVLNTVVSSVNVWIKTHENSGLVSASRDIEALLSPFATLLKWSKAVYTQYFKPLLQHFRPGLLATTDHSSRTGETGRAEWVSGTESIQPKVWEQGVHFFARMQDLEAVLRDTTQQRNLQIVRHFWLDSSEVDLSELRFPSQTIQQAAVALIRNTAHSKFAVFSLQSEANRYAEMHLSKVGTDSRVLSLVSSGTNGLNLFVHVMFQFLWSRFAPSPSFQSEVLAIPTQRCVTLESPSRRKLPICFFYNGKKPIGCVEAAVKYKKIMILALRSDYQVPEYWELPLCLSDQQGNTCYHTMVGRGLLVPFETNDSFVDYKWSYELKSGVHWASGRMAWIEQEMYGHKDKSSYSFSVVDFRRCADDINTPPELHRIVLNCSEFGSEVEEICVTSGLWALGMDSIWCLGHKQSATQPTLIEVRVSSGQTSPHHVIDWRSHFSQEELNSLSYAPPFLPPNISGMKLSNAASLTAAEETKILYLSLLQPEENCKISLAENPNVPLWIMCFQFGHRDKPASFLCRKCVSVGRELWFRKGWRESSLAKVIFVQRRNFLLLNLGGELVLAFTIVRQSLVQIKVNGAYISNRPDLPGELVLLRGMYTNYWAPFFVDQREDRVAGKILLDVHTLRFAF